MDKYAKSNTNKDKSIIVGIGWTSLSTLVNGLTQVLRLSILSRFLAKEDFGIVAILTFILGLTQVFSDMGFSASIMAQKNLDRKSFLNLYWIQFIVFNTMMVLIASFSSLIADCYNMSILKKLIPLMMLELFFISLGRLYDTVLQKNMQFKIIAIRNITTAFISLIIAVVIAVIGLGVYSLIISTVFNALSINFWNLFAGQSQYKLKFQKIKFKETRDLIRVGYFQMGTQIVDYLASKLDIFIISTFLGVGELGLYNLAKELVLKFVTIINSIINKVMLPVLANKQDNMTVLKVTFESFIEKLSLLNAPIVGFVVLFSDLIVQLFYGNSYIELSNIVQIMAIWSLFVVLGQPNALLAIATKKTNISFGYTIIRLFIMGLFLFLFARISLMATALTMLIVYAIMFVVNWKMLLNKVLSIKFIGYMNLFFRSWLCISIIITITMVIRSLHLFNNDSAWTICVIAIYILFVSLYFFTFEKKLISSLISKGSHV